MSLAIVCDILASPSPALPGWASFSLLFLIIRKKSPITKNVKPVQNNQFGNLFRMGKTDIVIRKNPNHISIDESGKLLNVFGSIIFNFTF